MAVIWDAESGTTSLHFDGRPAVPFWKTMAGGSASTPSDQVGCYDSWYEAPLALGAVRTADVVGVAIAFMCGGGDCLRCEVPSGCQPQRWKGLVTMRLGCRQLAVSLLGQQVLDCRPAGRRAWGQGR